MKFKASQSDRLFLLDGMRGLAAFAVIVDHVPSEALRTILPGRHLAVDFFFVLSGLVLARAYGASLSVPGGVRRFLALRFVRLYPMYLLGLFLGASGAAYTMLRGWIPFDPFDKSISLAANLFFLPSPVTIGAEIDNLYPYDGPAWTLFFELIANGLWAFSAIFLKGRLRLILLAVFAALAGYLVFVTPVLGAGWQWSYAHVGLARVLFSFLAGVTLHQLMTQYRLPRIPVIIPFCLFVFVLAFPVVESFRTAFDALVMIAVIPVTVLLAARTNVVRPVAWICDWLGSVSYGVYIIHVPMFLWLAYAGLTQGLPGFCQVLLVAGVSAFVAQMATGLYEVPLRRWLTARLSGSERPET